MEVTFEDKDLEEFVSDINNASKKFSKYAKDKKFYEYLVRVFQIFDAVTTTKELYQFSFLHYEKLKNCELSSIRIMNGRIERLIFRECNDGIEIIILELNNNHYGNKK